MKKNILLFSFLIFFLFVMSACTPNKSSENSEKIDYSNADVRLQEGEFMLVMLPSKEAKKIRIQAKVARTPKEREIGLMEVQHMPLEVGMIFLFEKADIQNFWMKNTLIPLDMIFIDDQMKVVHIAKAAQPCKADPCPLYSSIKPAHYVLEVNGGLTDTIGLKDGDQVELRTVAKTL